MSGGEGDRASIALTLALNRLSACPLIMLDESLDSLDLDMKETTIQTIRETTEATVLVIDYGMPEGYFDRVIDVDLLK
jgi:DNA repair exonuclease SbcCD ATPase subunit